MRSYPSTLHSWVHLTPICSGGDLFSIQSLLASTLPTACIAMLTEEVSDFVVFKVFKSMPHNKAPGPDGYTSEFFLASWEFVGASVAVAMKEFFTSGQLLKQINSTANALIPKIPHPTTITEFRPIFCCNILYKAIVKIIALRFRSCLPSMISWNQSAFIPGRRIMDNVH